jgi:hypothetical protein
MPSVVFSSATSTTLTFAISGTVDWGIYSNVRWELWQGGIKVAGPNDTGTTSYTWGSSNGLQPGVTYACYAWGVKPGGTTDSFGSASGTTLQSPPSPPSGLTISGRTSTSLTFSWTKGAGASTTELSWSGNVSGTASVTGTSYTVTVSYGGYLSMTAYSKNSAGNSSSVSTDGYALPQALSGLVLSFQPATSDGNPAYIHASWNASGGAYEYEVRLNGYSKGSVNWSITSYDFYDWIYDSNTVTVIPYNPAGNAGSGQSSTINVSKPQLATPTFGSSSSTTTTITVSINKLSPEPAGTTYSIRCSDPFGPVGTISGTSGTFSGLTASSQYTIEWWASNSNYLDSSHGTRTVSTASKSPYPAPSSAPTLNSVGYTSASISWPANGGAASYDVGYFTGTSLTSVVNGITGTSYSIASGNLSSNSTYTLKYRINPSNTSDYTTSNWSPGTTFTTLSTPPPAPQFDTNQTVKGQSSITVVWSSVALATQYNLQYKLSTDTTWIDWSITLTSTTSTVTGLTDGSSYDFRVRAYVPDAGNVWTSWSGIVTGTPGLRPQNWEWSTPKTQGGQFTTTTTATEWNNFATRINGFRAYKNLNNYSFTLATSGTAFTATMFNQAISAINEMVGHGTLPSSVATGDKIFASMLNQLRDALNAIQ